MALRGIRRVAHGDLFVIFAGKFGLVRFRKGRFLTEPQNVNGQPIVMAAAPDGSLWIGTKHGGVTHWKDGVLAHFGEREGLVANYVMSLSVDPDGTVWVGSSPGGLSRIRNGHVVTVMPDDGLFDFTVGTLTDDGYGYLWMTCDKGIYKVSKQELNDFAEGRVHSIHSIVYGTPDGLRSAECNYGTSPSASRAPDGRLWFATTAGLVSVDPLHSGTRTGRPAVVVESVFVDGQKTAVTNGLRTDKGSHDLQFDFAAPDFVAPERVHYRYRLDGFDEHWIEPGRREQVFYTRLPPGDYIMLVQASDGSGWPAHSTSMPVMVPPLFWQTIWFRVAVGLMVLLAGVGTYELRVYALRRSRRTLQECVIQRTAELQRAIREAEVAQEALHEQATRDGLTRLWNRRHIFYMLHKEARRAERERRSLCVLMLDIDHFKTINDTSGHLAGDRVLESVAGVLADQTRPYDYAGRYGGEEFLIIFCNCTLSNGMRRAETIRAAIASSRILYGDVLLNVTASFGLAVNAAGKTIEMMLQEADQALYLAKHHGRDRVCNLARPVSLDGPEMAGLMAAPGRA